LDKHLKKHAIRNKIKITKNIKTSFFDISEPQLLPIFLNKHAQKTEPIRFFLSIQHGHKNTVVDYVDWLLVM